MATRRDPIGEAARRAQHQLREALSDGRDARVAHGLPQAAVAGAMRCSRQAIGALERGRLDDVGVIQLARYCAAVGLDLSLRTFANGSPLRDAGQLRLIERLRRTVGDAWTWRTEVPVTADPRDLRAIDALLANGPRRVGVEAVSRLTDTQGQVRPIVLKQEAAGLACMVLVLADTRTHRRAVEVGAPTLQPAFPMDPRGLLAELRAGRQPPANGLILI